MRIISVGGLLFRTWDTHLRPSVCPYSSSSKMQHKLILRYIIWGSIIITRREFFTSKFNLNIYGVCVELSRCKVKFLRGFIWLCAWKQTLNSAHYIFFLLTSSFASQSPLLDEPWTQMIMREQFMMLTRILKWISRMID